MKNFDQIEKYLNGEINDDEKKAFKEKLANDPELKKDMELMMDVTKFIEDAGLTKFKEITKNIISKESHKYSEKKRRAFNAGILVKAASILVIAGISAYFIYSINQNKYLRLFNSYYSVYEYPDVSRSGIILNKNLKNMELALKKYNEEKYVEASNLYENEIQINSENVIAHFLLSICYIEMGENRKAINELAKLAENEKNLLNETAKWYLGLCYLKEGDNENALKVFHGLGNYPNYYKEKSGKILKKISRTGLIR